MSKEEQEAIRKINNIIQEWTDMRMDANDALELLLPLLKIITSYFERVQDLELKSPGEEKKSLYEDLEKDLDKENGDPALFNPEKEKGAEELLEEKSKEEEEDLFTRKNDEEEESDTEEEES